MSSLLKIKVAPVLSLTQREAAEALGGLEALRLLEDRYGLRPWDEKATLRRFSVSSIEAAMRRAEVAIGENRGKLSPKSPQSAAAE